MNPHSLQGKPRPGRATPTGQHCSQDWPTPRTEEGHAHDYLKDHRTQEAARTAWRGRGVQGSLSPVSAALSATRTRTPPRRRKLIFCAPSTCRMAVSLCRQRGQ